MGICSALDVLHCYPFKRLQVINCGWQGKRNCLAKGLAVEKEKDWADFLIGESFPHHKFLLWRVSSSAPFFSKPSSLSKQNLTQNAKYSYKSTNTFGALCVLLAPYLIRISLINSHWKDKNTRQILHITYHKILTDTFFRPFQSILHPHPQHCFVNWDSFNLLVYLHVYI